MSNFKDDYCEIVTLFEVVLLKRWKQSRKWSPKPDSLTLLSFWRS